MKKYIYLFLLIGLLQVEHGHAQLNTDTLKDSRLSSIDEFKNILQETYSEFDTARSILEMQSASNRFGLIAKKWSNEWASQYYACYSLTVISYIEKDENKRDAYLDEAEKLYDNASVLIRNENDEIYVMGAMLANARLAVKPASRFQKYGGIFNTDIDKAKNLQPNNPRIYYLQGTSLYFTPKAFGGGAKNALTYFEKAGALFQNEKQDDILKPFWGKKQNEDMLQKCRAEIK